MESELGNLQKLLDSNYEAPNSIVRKKCRAKQPVTKLSEALNRYKTERISTEDDLIKCI